MQEVFLYTDGACSGNPGRGGWAALLRYKEAEKTLTGGEMETTNNRMEMTAVIEGLRILKKKCKVNVVTDSQYVCKNAQEYLEKWRANGWRKSDKKEILNLDLWQQLHELLQKHDIVWHWVRGHNGHKENEIVDELARNAVPA